MLEWSVYLYFPLNRTTISFSVQVFMTNFSVSVYFPIISVLHLFYFQSKYSAQVNNSSPSSFIHSFCARRKSSYLCFQERNGDTQRIILKLFPCLSFIPFLSCGIKYLHWTLWTLCDCNEGILPRRVAVQLQKNATQPQVESVEMWMRKRIHLENPSAESGKLCQISGRSGGPILILSQYLLRQLIINC